MTLRELNSLIRRRWLIVLMGVLVTTGLCVGLVDKLPITYSAQTSLILLPPPSVVGDGGNPYLNLGGLGPAVDVLTRKLNTTEFSDPIQLRQPDSEYEALADGSTSGPILIITSTAPTEEGAIATMMDAIDAAPRALESLQASLSVPAPAQLTLASLSVDAIPTPDLKLRVQALGALIAVGIVGTLLLAGYRDGRIRVRRLRDESAIDEELENLPSAADERLERERKPELTSPQADRAR